MRKWIIRSIYLQILSREGANVRVVFVPEVRVCLVEEIKCFFLFKSFIYHIYSSVSLFILLFQFFLFYLSFLN